MKIGFLYAGQGSQKVGMGKDFYAEYAEYRNVLDAMTNAKEIKQISFEGPSELLGQTRHTQPCMVAFAAGISRLLSVHGIQPCAAAGLSLGEYSALQAAGVFTTAEAVDLVRMRGRAMEAAAEGIESKMVAVLNADVDLVRQACILAEEIGTAEIANLNCPGQVVVSGEKIAVEKVEEILSAAGVKRCIALHVSGPFHTSLMRPAGEFLRKKLADVPMGSMSFPVIFNVSGLPLQVGQAGETILEMLERQVQSSVLFEKSIRTMLDMGTEAFVEIGPGKALSGFVRRISKETPCYAVEDIASFNKAIQALEGSGT